MTLHLGAVLRAVLLPAGAAVLVGCANVPPPTPELARFDPQQGYRFTQTAQGADNTSSLLVVLTLSGGGTRAVARVRVAAKTLLAESASFQQLLRDLRARPRAGQITP